ncbi:hypothetical protein HU200_059704 [Digitaria exilis]|uniref:Uncharacterized protein n=1 Tax=Digitaria exilis TaxID=1010633 RepID=A0A835AB90_9POAL|nr:hypothetical protein HU200_059704 [Digitaria exilis]
MANKKMVVLVAALLLVAVALESAPAASAMDCKAGCSELKASPLGTADCEKKCAELSKGQDPFKAAKWDIP